MLWFGWDGFVGGVVGLGLGDAVYVWCFGDGDAVYGCSLWVVVRVVGVGGGFVCGFWICD